MIANFVTKLFFLAGVGAGGACCVSNSAAEPMKNCGEWTVCSGGTRTAAPHTHETQNAVVCGKDDELRCKNECHTSFGDAYWACVQKCLDGSCSPSDDSGREVWNAADDARGCIEIESKGCATQCSSGKSGVDARCRSDCLSGKCPQANRLDIATEAASPGALACDRCSAKVQNECSQLCVVGAAQIANPVNGLGNVICQKSCVTARCGTSCAFSF